MFKVNNKDTVKNVARNANIWKNTKILFFKARVGYFLLNIYLFTK